MVRPRLGVVWLQLLPLFVLGCASPDDLGPSEPELMQREEQEQVASVSLELTSVPAALPCIQVSAFSAPTGTPTGAALVVQNFVPTTGSTWAGTLSLGAFTKGNVQIVANGYGVACASVTISTAPTWVADPQILSVTPGVPSTATLTFRQNLGVQASGNFAPTVTDLSVGYISYGLRLADGTVRTSTNMQAPTGLTNVAELDVAYSHACARKNDGTVWCWGENNYGQLGNGTFTFSGSTPVQVMGLPGPATTLAVGFYTSCASAGNGTFCWGNNTNGALGDGTTTNRNVATRVFNMGASRSIATSYFHTCFVANGGMSCVGVNAYGQLGNGTTANATTPVQVSVIKGAVGVGVGENHSCAITAIGQTYCWGRAFEGQLGNGTTTSSSTPVLVGAIGNNAAEISVGIRNTCVRTNSGSLYCWGYNYSGEVGDGSGANQLSPVLVSLPSKAVAIRCANLGFMVFALLADGSVWAWGDNSLGTFGDGTFISRYKPGPIAL